MPLSAREQDRSHNRKLILPARPHCDHEMPIDAMAEHGTGFDVAYE